MCIVIEDTITAYFLHMSRFFRISGNGAPHYVTVINWTLCLSAFYSDSRIFTSGRKFTVNYGIIIIDVTVAKSKDFSGLVELVVTILSIFGH